MTTAFNISRDTIITAALRKLQVLELGTTPDASTLANAAQSLNIMIKSWQTQGIKLWTVKNYIIPLTATINAYTIGYSVVDTSTVTITIANPGVVTYTNHGFITGTPIVFTTTGALPTGLVAGTMYYILTVLDANTFTLAATIGGTVITTTGAQSGVHTATVNVSTTVEMPTTVTQSNDKPLKVIQAWMRNISVTPNIDTPLQVLSRQEYNILGSKNSPGMINSIWYNPSTSWGTVTTYLTPDIATATNYQLYCVGQRPLGDITFGTDITDFPSEWMQALIWGLADELSLEYGCLENYRKEIGMKAQIYRSAMEDWDTETTPTFFTPDPRARR